MTPMKALLFFSLPLFAACSSAPLDATKGSTTLCQQLPAELGFIHQTLAENNSNYNGNAEQRAVSDEAYKSILAMPCSSGLDYARAVKRYLASYHDPHVNSIWSTPDPTHESIIEISTGTKPPPLAFKLQWSATGVFLQRYNEHYYVKAIDHNLIGADETVKIGDELKSCNGSAPAKILQDEILPYLSVSAQEAAEYRFTPYIFARWDQKTDATYKCELFRNGSTVEAQLTWHKVPEDYIQKTFQPSPKKIYEIEKTPYGHWIKLKSLGGYDKESAEQLKQFVRDAQTLRNDRIIVMDLRGNSGGSSSWGTDWIHNLFGYEVNWEGKVKAFIFVSKGNIGHYERLIRNLTASGALTSAYAKAIWDDQMNALHSSEPGTFAPLSGPPSAKKPSRQKGFKGQVLVLTDYNVFSSGETFLEQLKMMPKVKQAGIASNASTYYSDIRFVITPGGLPFDFPTKMDSGDPLGRKSGEALAPDWPLSYDIESELRGDDSLRKALEHRFEKTQANSH